jgi:hypothetical protein
MLPDLDVGASCEAFEPYTQQTQCDPTPKPGVVAFRDFVIAQLGGSDLGIVRACDVGKASHHKEGRAWDWGNKTTNPDDVARVQTLFDWLWAKDKYGNDAANFKRVGLVSVIWNAQHWSTAEPSWRPYTGTNLHTDHVHFSFGWPGALAQLSFYQWLGTAPAPGPPAPPVASPESNYNLVGGLIVVGSLAYLTHRWWGKQLAG